jgi:hypothetical protein
VLEVANLQIDDQMVAKQPVVEHEIDVVVLVANGNSFLARLKTEPATEFEQEVLKVVQKRGLQLTFGIARLLGETDEFKNIWIPAQFRDLDAGV